MWFWTPLHAPRCDGYLPFLDSFLTFYKREETVSTPDRRSTPRFKLQTSLIFSRRKPLPDSEQKTRAINISATGVCFATAVDMSVGEVIEVVLVIPKRATGLAAVIRKFAGRITHIDPNHELLGLSHVGVQLLYCETFHKPQIHRGMPRECASSPD